MDSLCLLFIQVLAPLQGGLPQQTGVIIQPQQIVLASGNKVPGNTQVNTFSILSGISFLISVDVFYYLVYVTWIK